MRRALLPILVVLVLAGCGDEQSVAGTWKLGGEGPTLEFKDGKVTGSTGCNRLTAKYETDGDKLTLSDVATTRIACQSPTAKDEQDFLLKLAAVARFEVDEGDLVLRSKDGKDLLRLTE